MDSKVFEGSNLPIRSIREHVQIPGSIRRQPRKICQYTYYLTHSMQLWSVQVSYFWLEIGHKALQGELEDFPKHGFLSSLGAPYLRDRQPSHSLTSLSLPKLFQTPRG